MGGAGRRRRHDDGYREPLSRFPTCTRLRRRYCSTACSLVTGRPATSVSAAHTITPSRVRRLCVRRAYFRRRRTRHARSLRRVVTAAAVRFYFSLIFLPFFFLKKIFFHSRAIACGEGARAPAWRLYTRVCLRERARVCSGILLRYYKWYTYYTK